MCICVYTYIHMYVNDAVVCKLSRLPQLFDFNVEIQPPLSLIIHVIICMYYNNT